ncbi:MAG: hypothetical protein ABR549_00910 [Mycobacteriales bacterium]
MTREALEPGQLLALEMLASSAYGETEAVTEVIRPSAVLPEKAALRVVSELSVRDARTGGVWVAEPTCWRRYSGPWNGPDGDAGDAQLLGTIQVAYGTPARYDITVFRVTITDAGAADDWTVERLCDEAFGYGGLTLASCPRTALVPPPRPFRIR